MNSFLEGKNTFHFVCISVGWVRPTKFSEGTWIIQIKIVAVYLSEHCN